jgi:5-methylcytosine-specific restriction endonuclease McrA
MRSSRLNRVGASIRIPARDFVRTCTQPEAARRRKVMLARTCPSCGILLPVSTRGRCPTCTRPPRSGSSRPELDRSAWQRLRRAARLRDGNRCVRCGSTRRLSVHHAVEGSNALDDLLTLCGRCHAREHARAHNPWKAGPFFKRERTTPTARSAPVSSRSCGMKGNHG